MIQGRTILCFGSGYDAPPTSKHHVMHLLAERNTVLWVNYHASRTPTASSSDLAYMVKKLRQVFGGIKKPRQNLYVLTPLVVPLPSRPWARRLNRLLLIRQVRAALARIQDGPVQIWSFTPDISYVLGHFGEEKVVYYCVDDHASFSGYDKDQVLRDEADLCRRADLVVTTSTALQEAKSPLNPNTILVTHGVDYEHFSKALTEDLPVPDDMKNIPHPILGFFGLIRDWVDLDLLAEVARRRADWHIVLLGDSTVDLALYRGIPNMHFLGRRPYAQLPAYCKAFDVGLIPFRINELTRAVNPIKLREYLAAGLPVVSTPMPEVRLYSHLIEIADTAEGFVRAVESALVEGPNSRLERVNAMSRETWQVKREKITQALSLSVPVRPGVSGGGKHCKIAVIMSGGGFMIEVHNLLEQCPSDVDIILVAPQHMQEYCSRRHKPTSLWMGVTRQSRSDGSIKTLCCAIVGTVHALRLLAKERPEGVVGIGQRAAFYYLLAGKLLGMKTVYVECITRITRLSTTGRVIAWLRLADRFYVQWPEATKLYHRAEYVGRLL